MFLMIGLTKVALDRVLADAQQYPPRQSRRNDTPPNRVVVWGATEGQN
jgi:hypothetical protein